ncbi:MAG TPA: lipopolysaccharide kinase InaA family protein [Pseudomonadales bacterium]
MRPVTFAELGQLTAASAVPFELRLPETGALSGWTCREILRVLPGRRLVVRAAMAGGDDVVLKLFYGSGHRRYCLREGRGLEWLAAAGLPVPDRLGRLTACGLSGLILRYLPDVRPVLDVDQGALETLAEQFGRLHAAGYRQTDQHLDNFVISRGVVHALDGDGVRRRAPLGGRRAELDNLALLAAQRAPRYDGGLPGLLAAYARGRGTPPPALGSFRRRLARWRRVRMHRYLAKSRRNCSEFAVRREPGRTTYAVRGEGEGALLRLFARPLDRTAVEFLPGEVLKAGNSATVVRTLDQPRLVVKRFNVKSFGHGLRRTLHRVPRYRRAWMYGQLLTLLDIPTARPMLLVEEQRLFWRGVAYLAQSDLGGLDLPAEVAARGLSEARCTEIADLFSMLRSAGLCHGDTKASNFVVHQDRVHLIDLDAMRLSSRGTKADVRRFLANWSGPERARLEKAFAEAGLL